MIWDDAQAYCKGMNGMLTRIEKAFENAFIWHLTTQVPNVTFGAWIGGHTNSPAAGDKADWRWSDGSHMQYSNWQDGKPDNWNGCHGLGFNDDTQKCMEIWVYHGGDPDSAHVSMWNDQCCHRPLNFVCEKKTRNC